MIDINLIAVRAFNRVWNPLAERMYEGECYDRHFDGGEWSAPAWSRIRESEYDACLARVGARFGIAADRLAEMVEYYVHGQYYREF